MNFDQGVLSKHLFLQVQQYEMPEFQRPYSWAADDWRTLWADILRQYRYNFAAWKTTTSPSRRNAHLRNYPTHYLGTIVTADPLTVVPPTSKVIDGQQRLVTATIALMAARDVRLRRLGTAAARAAEREVIVDSLSLAFTNPGATGIRAWRLVPQEMDREAYVYLINADRLPKPIDIAAVSLGEDDSAQILTAYNWFLREMSRSKLSSPPFELMSFEDLFPLDAEILADTIMNRLYAIKIIADATDDANMIFESLNAKGRDLQQVDLIKNFLYLSLDDEASEVYKTQWRPMEKFLRQGELERYTWASLVSQGENTLQKRTYEAVQRKFGGGDVDDVRAYVVGLRSEAALFERMLRPDKEPELQIARALEDLKSAGGATAAPLVLYCYRELRSDEATTTEFLAALNAIESFLVRRMLVGAETNNLNSKFGVMCTRLHNENPYRAGDGLVTDVRRILSSRQEDWPTDEAVAQGIATLDFYNAQKVDQRLHVLRRLDRHYNVSGVHVDYESSQKTIEHIAPQSVAAPEWIASLSPSEWDALQERINTLPNLTLLTASDNSSLGRSGWLTKRDKYVNYGYSLTARIAMKFADEETWTSISLDRRAADLTEAVLKEWPRDFVGPREVGTEQTAAAVDIEDRELENELDAMSLTSVPQESAVDSSLLDSELDDIA